MATAQPGGGDYITTNVTSSEIYSHVFAFSCDFLVENFDVSGTCCSLTNLDLEGCEVVVSNGYCDVLQLKPQFQGDSLRRLLITSTNSMECPVGGYEYTLNGIGGDGDNNQKLSPMQPTMSPLESSGSRQIQWTSTLQIAAVLIFLAMVIS